MPTIVTLVQFVSCVPTVVTLVQFVSCVPTVVTLVQFVSCVPTVVTIVQFVSKTHARTRFYGDDLSSTFACSAGSPHSDTEHG